MKRWLGRSGSGPLCLAIEDMDDAGPERVCPRTIAEAPGVTKCLLLLARHVHRCRALSLTGSMDKLEYLDGLDMPLLEELCLAINARSPSVDEAMDLFRAAPRLRALTCWRLRKGLDFWFEFPYENLTSLTLWEICPLRECAQVLRCCERLLHCSLHFFGYPLWYEDIGGPVCVPQLKTLHLDLSSDCGADNLLSVLVLPALEELKVEAGPGWNSEPLIEIFRRSDCALEVLDISGMGCKFFLDENEFVDLLAEVPTLKRLYMAGTNCCSFNPCADDELVPALEELHITSNLAGKPRLAVPHRMLSSRLQPHTDGQGPSFEPCLRNASITINRERQIHRWSVKDAGPVQVQKRRRKSDDEPYIECAGDQVEL
ncbi:hypothetical protein OE88DRAFT_1654494 [Heliocybe sulcata]|uniref:RNI-like protein n=1 Tax=Heliocybe sulcata TaxID=5364 RepID=A0A5C3NDE5_9AGAM|nr:hypothetical protein OE88DRAFT_1654494 [Heliocybe sulcata]